MTTTGATHNLHSSSPRRGATAPSERRPPLSRRRRGAVEGALRRGGSGIAAPGHPHRIVRPSTTARRLRRSDLRGSVGIHHRTTASAAISGGTTGGSPRPGGSIAAERAMSSSGSVRSLPGTRETPPFAFPEFCRTIGWVLDDEQGPRGNSERRGAGLALSPAIVDRLIGRGVNAVGISPRRGWPSAACAPHGATTRPMAPLKTTTMAVPGR